MWFVALLCISCLSYHYWSEIKRAITIMFNLEWLEYLLVGLSAIITILHKTKFRKLKFSENMSFAQFKVPLEEILSFVSNPITLVCSYSLARGLFLQCTGQEVHFPHFTGIQIAFVTIVIGYLLYSSLWELIRRFWELATRQPQLVTPQASDKDGHHITTEGDHHKK